MGAHKFNYAPKFPQNGILSPKFCIFGRQFVSDKKKVLHRLKFRWEDFHNATGFDVQHDAQQIEVNGICVYG